MRRKDFKLNVIRLLRKREMLRPLNWQQREKLLRQKVRLQSKLLKIKLPKSEEKWRQLELKNKELMMLRELLPLKCKRLMKRIKGPKLKLRQLRKRSKKLRLFLKRRMLKPKE